MTSRNFDDLASILSDAFGAIEKDSAAFSKLLASISRIQTKSAQVPLTLTTGTYTLDGSYSDLFCDCTGGAITLTLPSAVWFFGKIIRAYKIDTSTNTLTVNGTVLGGNSGASIVVWQSNGVAWKLMHLYDEGTYTATLTGCTTSPTGTAKYVKNGKSVILKVPSITATSNTTACTVTGMPSHLFPSANIVFSCADVVDNSLDHLGLLVLDTSGVFTGRFYSAITTLTPTFTNVGTKGFTDIMASYTTQ